MRCIFCRSEEDLTDEHVFPAFMGGELVVLRGSCKVCNGAFGVYESAVKKSTASLLNLLEIENRDGKIPNVKVTAVFAAWI